MNLRLRLSASAAAGLAGRIGAALALFGCLAAVSGGAAASPPADLADTGLYVPGSTDVVRADNLPFTPQYPLWSDGAAKRRWMHIPAGTFIDASQADAWVFPPGTKLWKEFSHGRRVETRLIERLDDGTWRYATYLWNAEGTRALLAPADGIRALPVSAAPRGRYVVPGDTDCRACHEGAAVPVLGVGTLQLSPDRDPLAPHAEPARPGDADLRVLVERGWLRNLPGALRDRNPRIDAPTPEARAALGYLHGNCGQCHNTNGAPPPVDLALARGGAEMPAYESIVAALTGTSTRYRSAGTRAGARLVDPGSPDTSVLVARMQSRNPLTQMPPIGTQLVDAEALSLIERWIRDLPRGDDR